MRGSSSAVRGLVVLVLLGFWLSACALGRSVVEVPPPVSTATGGQVFAKVTDVRDLRRFETNPGDPSQPSLSDAAEINDPEITSRAVARKRNGFGLALGDVALPDGHSVTELVRGAAQAALQDKGYTVVTEASPNYAAARPLTVDIQKFWAWSSPGFAEIMARFNSSVVMTGDMVADGGPAMAEGRASYGSVAVFESTWADVIRRGLADLSEKMKAQLIAADAPLSPPAPGPSAAKRDGRSAESVAAAVVAKPRPGPLPATVAFTAPTVGTRFYLDSGGYLEIATVSGSSVTTVNAALQQTSWVGLFFTPGAASQQFSADAVESIWPLEVGKSVTFDLSGMSTSGSSGAWTETLTVLRQEEIVTEAGRFQTFVVEKRERSVVGSFESVSTRWYAPEVGFIVKSEYRVERGTGRPSTWTVTRIVKRGA